VSRVALVFLAFAAFLPVGHADAAATTPAVSAVTSMSPRAAYFGDPITATLRVSVDPRRVDPAQVALTARFAPFAPEAPPRRTAISTGGTTVVTYVFRLECFQRTCLPSQQGTSLEFRAAAVTYRLRRGGRAALTIDWPSIALHSRISAPDVRGRLTRTGLESLPAARLGASTSTLVDVLAAVAGFLAAVALGIGWILRPRRTRTEALPTQLELALQAVEAAADNGDPFTRRTALDALARALDQGEDGAGATAARRLAWKAEVPLPAAMHALVATVRDELRESA
jgi:hypothetical protein